MDRLKEFNDLENMLAAAGIEYEREDKEPEYSVFDFHQLRSKCTFGERYVWDVICHRGSYGYEQGTLEIYGYIMEEPEGWLNAKECLDKIKKCIKEFSE